MGFNFEHYLFKHFICKLSKRGVFMIDNFFIKEALQTPTLSDDARKRRRTAVRHIQVNEEKWKNN